MSARRRPEGAGPNQRICEGCGGLRHRLAKRCRRCWRESVKGNEVKTGQSYAKRIYSLDGITCQYKGCKAPARDRHHIDGDTLNNAPGNVAFYCRRHHMLIDGRLDRLRKTLGNRGNRLGASTGRPRRAA